MMVMEVLSLSRLIVSVQMKASIKVIKEHPQSAEGLLNALK